MKLTKTNNLKVLALSTIFACSLNTAARAENVNSLEGVKLGFGYDMGLGITAQTQNINAFLGNDGLAVDYLLVREGIKGSVPAQWYIGAGGFAEWSGDFGVRLPVGLQANFANNFDAYTQIIPELEIGKDTGFGLGIGLGIRHQF